MKRDRAAGPQRPAASSANELGYVPRRAAARSEDRPQCRASGAGAPAGAHARQGARGNARARPRPPARSGAGSGAPRRRGGGAQRAARRRMGRERALREAAAWIVTLALAALVGLGVRGFVFELVRVEGPSMSPTLEGGEVVLVTRFDYLAGGPERGDVVLCRYPNREGTFIKRVAALPGEVFEIRGGAAYVNGAPLEEDYVQFKPTGDYGPVLIGDGQYLLLGDNRAVSHDSRAGDVGTLSADAIVGRARCVVYPLGEARSLVN